MSGPAVDHEASATELKLLVKDWRTGRATKTLWEAVQDAYVAVLAVAVIGAMVVHLVMNAQTGAASCSTMSCVAARAFLPFAALAALLALAVGASRLFGPVLASAAEGFWMLDAPIDRSRLLRSRLGAAIALAGLAGATSGALLALVTGSALPLVGAWAVAAGLAAAAVVAFAAAEQGADRTLWTRVAGYLLTAVSVACLVAVIGIAAGWFSLSLGFSRELLIVAVVAATGAVALTLSAVLAFARLNRIRRARLTSGGSLAAGMAGAMYALDLGLIHDIVVDKNAVERGQVRSRPGKGAGLDALVRRDLARVSRTPTVLLPALITVVVPYAAVALGLGRFTPMVAALALFAALIGLMGMLRVLTRTSGLARCFPFTGPELRRAALIVPAGVAVGWSVVVVPSMTSIMPARVDAIPLAALTAAAGLLGAARWITAKPIDFAAPMFATQAGAMPTGMVANAIKGFEVVLVITAPLAFGLPWIVSAVLALICFWIVTNPIDLESLKEQQEAQREELAQARADRERKRAGR